MSSSRSSADTVNSHNIFPNSNLVAHEQQKKSATCCGRQVTSGCCLSTNTLYAIALIVGSILLIVGLLVLAGHLAPTSGGSFVTFLQKINLVASLVASKLGSDLFTLAVFSTSFGAAATLTGTVGLCINKCRPEAPIKGDSEEEFIY